MMTRLAIACSAIFALLSLGSCASQRTAPAEDRSAATAPLPSLPNAATPLSDVPAAPATALRAPPRALSLIFGGDVMFGRYFAADLRQTGGPAPFQGIEPLLTEADLAIVNLETPLSDVDPHQIIDADSFPKRHLRFRAPTRYASELAANGVDVAVLANNHAEDCNKLGLVHTIDALARAGVTSVGASVDGDPFKPVRVALGPDHHATVLAATTRRNRGTPRPGQEVPVAFGTTRQLSKLLPRRVAELRADKPGDLIVVTLHWGGEFSPLPHRSQTKLARRLIDAGANVVHGHHAHILQPVEVYEGGVILYNTGNLIFDMNDIRGRRSALFGVSFRPTPRGFVLEDVEVTPLLIAHPDAGPMPVEGDRATPILGPLAARSDQRFATTFARDGDRLRWPLELEAALEP